MNWQPDPSQTRAHRGQGGGQSYRPMNPGYPFSPYVAPNPDDTGVTFRSQYLPPYQSNLMPNVPLAEPPWGQPLERVNNPQLPRWGEPAGMQPPPAADPQGRGQGDAFPGAVPHNRDIWPWNLDKNNTLVAPDVARRKFAMRRPPKQKSEHRAGMPRYHSFTLAPRPPDWRPDFPKRSTGLFRCLRERKSARGVDYTLHPLLLYTGPDTYPIHYDLRQEPEVIDITFMNLDRPANSLDFCQIATTPPVDELCLWHRRFPWYIHIHASQSNGITIQDVLCQMYNQLAEQLSDRDYWTTELTAQNREDMRTAHLFRTAENLHRRKHLARMDFLKFDCVFLGLAKSKDGMWEIKTEQAIP